jgi:hypothetical protein
MASAWKRTFVVIAIVLAMGIGWLAVRQDPRAPVEREVAGAIEPGPTRADTTRGDAHVDVSPQKVAKRARVSRAERDEIYRRILAGLAERGSAAAPDEPNDEPSADPREEEPRERTPIRNRLGDKDGWGDALSDLLTNDFVPLADECFADARERNPDLAGMAAIEVTVVADEDIGGVVESATPAPDNEITDAGFVECMRESMLSTVLPPPPDSGRRDVMISLRFDEE